jgi:ABC-type glutathione transport system ATPase component
MLSLSMVVIAALVGADGLGKPVVNALNTADIALGFEAGLAIVLLAIMLDRICKQPDAKERSRRMSIIRFDNVDVIFAKDPREALGLLDQGMTRDQILKKTGQIVGVEKASLDIDKGEICVLMGLSGSGKSSLLRCINGLNTVSRGQLYVEHEGKQIDIASCSPAELKMMRTNASPWCFRSSP